MQWSPARIGTVTKSKQRSRVHGLLQIAHQFGAYPKVGRGFGPLRGSAANDNRPRRLVQRRHPFLSEPIREDDGAIPEWLLRIVMVLCTAGSMIMFWLALPWLVDLL